MCVYPATLINSIERYRTETRKLQESTTIGDQWIVDVVLLRESLARETAALPLESELIRILAQGDESLRKISKKQLPATTLAALKRYRETVSADATHWWLSIDELVTVEAARRLWLWTALAGTSFAIALGLMTDVIGRFLKDGPDFFSGVLIAVQAAIAILTGAAFTNSFWSWLDSKFLSAKLPIDSRPKIHAFIALVALGTMIGTYALLPVFARHYNDWGVNRVARGDVGSAMDYFKRALALDPDLSAAHYNLGDAYERALLPEQAISEYRLAMLLEPQHLRASNNVARLIILEGKSVPTALQILHKIIASGEEGKDTLEPDQWYAAYKNRGWAYFALKEFSAAIRDLEKALTYNPQGASAYCLLAKSMSEMSKDASDRMQINGHWRNCIAYAPADVSFLGVWLYEARRALGDTQ